MKNKYWTLFWQFRKIQLMKQVEYRGAFIFWSIVSFMWTGFTFFFFSLIAGVNNGIGGWNQQEIYALIAVFTIVDAFIWGFFNPNMVEYTQKVFSGELTSFLTKPINTQFLLMTQSNNYHNFLRIFLGIAILNRVLPQLGIVLNLASIVIFILIIFTSLTFIYMLWFILGTFSFWVDKLENVNHILPAISRIWQVPREVYTGLTATILTLVLPLGLIVTLPTEVLLQRAALKWLLYLLIFTTALTFFSRWFFQFSVKKYSGIGN
jgi:ABC-2 type transport system permease protein